MTRDERFGKIFSREVFKSRYSSVNNEMNVGNKIILRDGKVSSDRLKATKLQSHIIESDEIQTNKHTTNEINSQTSTTNIQILNPQSSDPDNPTNGTIWYDSNDNEIYIWMNGGKQRLKHENV